MSARGKRATLAAIVIIASACAGSTTSPTSQLASVGMESPTAVVSAIPSPTPIAVLDGEPWIVFGWPRVATDGRWAIFLMRPDGSDAHEIAADVPGEHKAAAWSPDGKRLAFVVQDTEHPEGSIWTVNADGSQAALLSDGGAECPSAYSIRRGRPTARGWPSCATRADRIASRSP